MMYSPINKSQNIPQSMQGPLPTMQQMPNHNSQPFVPPPNFSNMSPEQQMMFRQQIQAYQLLSQNKMLPDDMKNNFVQKRQVRQNFPQNQIYKAKNQDVIIFHFT